MCCATECSFHQDVPSSWYWYDYNIKNYTDLGILTSIFTARPIGVVFLIFARCHIVTISNAPSVKFRGAFEVYVYYY